MVALTWRPLPSSLLGPGVAQGTISGHFLGHVRATGQRLLPLEAQAPRPPLHLMMQLFLEKLPEEKMALGPTSQQTHS